MFTILQTGVKFIKGYGLILAAPITIIAIALGPDVLDFGSDVLATFDPIMRALD